MPPPRASMRINRRHSTSKGYGTFEKVVVWKNSTFSVNCLWKGCVSDVVSSLMNGSLSCRSRTKNTLPGCDLCNSCCQAEPWMQPMMRSRLGRRPNPWSIIEMAISLLPSQRYFYLCLRTKLIPYQWSFWSRKNQSSSRNHSKANHC